MSTIVVCYEERPVAPRMLERAALIAKALEARVIVTSVAPVLHSRGGPIDAADPPARHEAEAEEAAARLRELGVAEVETVPGIGNPARFIVELAESREADLIILGAHDGGLLSRAFHGDVGGDVVHTSPTDVLVVR
jgi:nucleotide-binding universal stress UspA family protein